MCTIDLFHCGSQQWLFAPQHTAPQEEPGEHTETQSLQTKRGCPSLPCSLSQFTVSLVNCSAATLRLCFQATENIYTILCCKHKFYSQTHSHAHTHLDLFYVSCLSLFLFQFHGYFSFSLFKLNGLMAFCCRVWRGWEPSGKKHYSLQL